jgi:hypothetical protein
MSAAAVVGSADPFEVMAIYEVASGLIVRAHFVRP